MQGVEFILPTDVIIADKFAEDAESKVVPVENIPDGWMVSSGQRSYSSKPCAMLRMLLCLPAAHDDADNAM